MLLKCARVPESAASGAVRLRAEHERLNELVKADRDAIRGFTERINEKVTHIRRLTAERDQFRNWLLKYGLDGGDIDRCVETALKQSVLPSQAAGQRRGRRWVIRAATQPVEQSVKRTVGYTVGQTFGYGVG